MTAAPVDNPTPLLKDRPNVKTTLQNEENIDQLFEKMARDDPAEYYKQTPFMRSLQDQRAATWVRQAFEQELIPAYDAWDPQLSDLWNAPTAVAISIENDIETNIKKINRYGPLALSGDPDAIKKVDEASFDIASLVAGGGATTKAVRNVKKSGAGSELLSSMKTRFKENGIVKITKEAVQLDASPIVKLSGKELDKFSGIDLKNDVKQLRKAAVDYYNSKLLGTKINNPVLGDIEFTKRGRDKFKSSSARSDKIKLLPIAPDLIKKAKLVDIEKLPSTTKGFRFLYFVKGTVKIGGKEKEVAIALQESNSGKLFYNINYKIEGLKKNPNLSEIQAQGRGSPVNDLVNRIIDDGSNVNLFFLAPLPVIAANSDNKK